MTGRRTPMARRPRDRWAIVNRILWILLLAALVAAIAVAWSAVPEPELIQAGI